MGTPRPAPDQPAKTPFPAWRVALDPRLAEAGDCALYMALRTARARPGYQRRRWGRGVFWAVLFAAYLFIAYSDDIFPPLIQASALWVFMGVVLTDAYLKKKRPAGIRWSIAEPFRYDVAQPPSFMEDFTLLPLRGRDICETYYFEHAERTPQRFAFIFVPGLFAVLGLAYSPGLSAKWNAALAPLAGVLVLGAFVCLRFPWAALAVDGLVWRWRRSIENASIRFAGWIMITVFSTFIATILLSASSAQATRGGAASYVLITGAAWAGCALLAVAVEHHRRKQEREFEAILAEADRLYPEVLEKKLAQARGKAES